MPIVDFPLAELYKYQGINPRPHDFDAYGTKQLRRLAAIDPQIELSPATFRTFVSRAARRMIRSPVFECEWFIAVTHVQERYQR